MAGILVEARPQSGWAVLGIGVNVAVDVADLPAELHGHRRHAGPRAATSSRTRWPSCCGALERRLAEPAAASLEALRARDALLGRRVEWDGGEGVGAGIDDAGLAAGAPRATGARSRSAPARCCCAELGPHRPPRRTYQAASDALAAVRRVRARLRCLVAGPVARGARGRVTGALVGGRAAPCGACGAAWAPPQP